MRILETSKTLNHGSRFLSAVKNRRLKILEVTTYTAGICGVSSRVLQEADILAKHGHEVTIFSTNHVKGKPNEYAPAEERRGRIFIRRFPAKKLGGESFTYWHFKRELLLLKPDIIISHAFRHTHTTSTLHIANKLEIPCFLVTHAPFNTGNEQRSLVSSLAIKIYDYFIAPKTLKQFSKIIAITHWELPYLHRLGIPKEKIAYIPNGIPSLFFTQKPAHESPRKIIYFGRLSPVKDLETVIHALSLIKNKSISLELAGPAEQEYLAKLKSLIASLRLESRVSFTPAIYNLKKKISKLDSAHVFVLPSKREGMPQSLIEAMSRKKLVIASDNLGARELIHQGENGFLFPIGNAQALAAALDKTFSLPISKAKILQNTARASVKQFAWDIVIKKLEKLLQETTTHQKD